ncbi:hypothetical protein Riv7116_6807 [Rivularia sp. PCC 7116]|nr:hypothetical protein Riv7116_6807 [Rivularia sp. PCC 7116]
MPTYDELWLTRLTEDQIEPLEVQDVQIMEDYELNNYWTVKKLLSSGLVFGVNSKSQCFFGI